MESTVLSASGLSEVHIQHFGAHITSWKNQNGIEMLYISPTAVYDGERAIRGGIPICFPQFGNRGTGKKHGFARTTKWSIDESYSNTGNRTARFSLLHSDETRNSEWPHKFHCLFTVTLSNDGNNLTLSLRVKNLNKDGRAFSFTSALHAYVKCNSEIAKLPGFKSLSYIDSIDTKKPGARKTQEEDISFLKEVDRIYMNTPDEICFPSADLRIRKKNFPDVVVWNPYIFKSKALSDLPDDDWKKFICIEPSCITDPTILQPTDEWNGVLQFHSLV